MLLEWRRVLGVFQFLLQIDDAVLDARFGQICLRKRDSNRPRISLPFQIPISHLVPLLEFNLRPDTQTIWLGLVEDEKRRFLRHLFRYWEIIRSRIPPEKKAIIDAMRASGQLDVLAGRIRDLAESGAAMEVHYVPRGRTRHEVATAALVINCIGPESDYRRIDHPLVRNLMRRGLIRPGPAHLGVDALLNGAIIGQNGAASAPELRNALKTVTPAHMNGPASSAGNSLGIAASASAGAITYSA